MADKRKLLAALGDLLGYEPLLDVLSELLSYEDVAKLLREALTRQHQQTSKAAPAASRKAEPDWSKEIRTCTQCGHEGPVEKDFGVHTRRGRTNAQTWCRKCRSTTSKNYPRNNSSYRAVG